MANLLKNLFCQIGTWSATLMNYFKPPKKFDSSSIKKILILKQGMVGDVLMTTPLVRAIKKEFSDSRIVYAVGKESKEVITDNPYLTKVIELVSLTDKTRPLKEKIAFIRNLRKEKFDIVFVLDLDLVSMFLAYLTKALVRIGLDSEKRGFLLTHKVLRKDFRHERERYLDLLRVLNIKTNEKKMNLIISNKDRLYAERFFKKKGLGKTLITGIGPGGAKNPGDKTLARRWTAEGYAKLSDKLAHSYKAKIIIFGGKYDKRVAKKIVNLMKFKAINLVGKTSLKQAAALIKKCDLFITHDCGLMHIAAAIGTPTITIFGPTDPRDVKPDGKSHIAIRKRLPCSPCLIRIKNYYPQCKTSICMKSVTAEDVFNKVKKMIKRKKNE